MQKLLYRLLSHQESRTSALWFGMSFGSTAVLIMFKITGQLTASWTLIAIYAGYLFYTTVLAILSLAYLVYLQYLEKKS